MLLSSSKTLPSNTYMADFLIPSSTAHASLSVKPTLTILYKIHTSLPVPFPYFFSIAPPHEIFYHWMP